MELYGNGSSSSPIVISDDEEAAFVEQELGGFEARLTDPISSFEPPMDDVSIYEVGLQLLASSSNLQMNGSNNAMQAPAPVVGQKRKRNQNVLAETPNAAQETKSQRKKRRRADRYAGLHARAQGTEAISSSPIALRTRSKVARLPEHPATSHDAQYTGILPPVSWSASFTAHTAAMPKPYIPALPPKPLPSAPPAGSFPTAFTHFPEPATVPQLAERRQPPPHFPPPLPPTPTSHTSLPKPVPVSDAANAKQVPVAPKKILGMPRESDKKGRQGAYPDQNLRRPLPDPTRTLVLAPIPKKYRNTEFIRHWARRFARPQPLRVDVDKTNGKALVEFQSIALAEMAHGSQRLTGEGKEHIRAWWYRGRAKNPSDLEEGEIEEGVVEEPPAPQPVNKKKQSKKEKKAEKRKAQAATQMKTLTVPGPPAQALPAAPLQRPSAPVHVPMPVPLPLPVPSTATASVNAALPSSSKSAVQPSPASGSPSPHAYRGRADYLERVEKYGGMTDDESGSEKEWCPAELERSWYYYNGTFNKRDYQDEEQAMDLESDDEEPGPREERLSPGSRYSAWGESAMLAGGMAAESTSIASSRASSADREHDEEIHVDDVIPAIAPAAATTKPVMGVPQPPVLSKPPTPPLSPSVFTMVEPPTAPLPSTASVSFSATPLASRTKFTRAVVASTSPPQPAVHAPSMSASILISGRPSSATGPNGPLPEPVAVALPAPVASEPSKRFDDTSASSQSAQPSSTPHVESSPVAVSAKRTLLEKQKDLEERIARAKAELARKSAVPRASNSSNTSPEEEHSKSAGPRADVADDTPAVSADMLSAEELRRSALKSRKKAGSASLLSTGVSNKSAVMSGNVSSSTPAGEVSVSVTAATPEGNSVNFDDLAISFITETLQTVQPPPSDPDPTPTGDLRPLQSVPSTASTTPRPPTPTSLVMPVKSNQATEKLLLAARQKRLEQHIAETKVLMAKLGTAKSKAEKDKVLSMLRERQRAMDEDMKADVSPKPASPSAPPQSFALNGYVNHHKPPAPQAWQTYWPEPSKDAMILLISDDEDDED